MKNVKETPHNVVGVVLRELHILVPPQGTEPVVQSSFAMPLEKGSALVKIKLDLEGAALGPETKKHLVALIQSLEEDAANVVFSPAKGIDSIRISEF